MNKRQKPVLYQISFVYEFFLPKSNTRGLHPPPHEIEAVSAHPWRRAGPGGDWTGGDAQRGTHHLGPLLRRRPGLRPPGTPWDGGGVRAEECRSGSELVAVPPEKASMDWGGGRNNVA